MAEAYAMCRRIVQQAGSNFYYGMRLLPAAKRRAMYAVYAFSRLADDAVDEYRGEAAWAQLRLCEQILQQAAGADYAKAAHPVAQALGDAIHRFGLPVSAFRELLQGMRMDLGPVRFKTLEDLIAYCRHVAGTVGQISLEIFGYRDPEAPALAVDMGIALQLTNILRDLKEDASRDRVYLPAEDLAWAGYTEEELKAGMNTPAFQRLMARESHYAHEYFRSAQRLFPLIEADARWCVKALYSIYYEILVTLEKRRYDVFHARVHI
jgi:phytoene synthase